MTPVPLTINAGTTFAVTAFVKDGGAARNLTGYTARMQLRRGYFTTGTPSLDLTSDPGGGLVITPAEGKVEVSMTPARTATLKGNYVYDLIITASNGDVFRILEGTATVTPQVTRP